MTQTKSRESLTDLLSRAISLGLDAADALRTAVPQVELPRMNVRGDACCEIPPPCWWPRDAGEVTSVACEGAEATLRIRVTNCGPQRRDVQIEAPAGVSVDQPKLSLGPMERAVVTARRQGAGEALVWVRGCNEHFVRWTVKTSRRALSSCHEIEIEDCPDYRHHWYDHFYCERPCPASAQG